MGAIITHIRSFSPVSRKDSRVLILGTMPGKESLMKNEYYANPRNSFWRVIGTILSIDAKISYSDRKTALLNQGIALWDVLMTCTRDSSLDSDIVETSIICNDFIKFFASHPNIHKIFFNGAKAEILYAKHILPNLSDQHRRVSHIRLPSTSPANAGKTLNDKISEWRVIVI